MCEPDTGDFDRQQKLILTQAFWLFCVISGLASKEALEAFLRELFRYDFSPFSLLLALPHAIRVLICLVLVIRFYVGAFVFADIAHHGKSATRGYRMDFAFSVIAFILLYALASTCKDIPAHPHFFSSTIILVLSLDAVWLIALYIRGRDSVTSETPSRGAALLSARRLSNSLRHPTIDGRVLLGEFRSRARGTVCPIFARTANEQVLVWVGFNAVSLLLGAIVFVITLWCTGWDSLSQIIALAPLAYFSGVDMSDMFGKRTVTAEVASELARLIASS